MPGPTLSISLEEWNAALAAKQQAFEETVAVRKELEIAKGVNGDERVAKVTTFARHCLTIARFAVANLPPETIKRWPYDSLRGLANTIECLPDFSTDDRDMAIDLLDFARHCEELELRRRGEVPVVQLPPVDTGAHDA